ncbi:MAG TPA: hypothetical protein VIK80_09590 [Flavihumibacter sp.]|jgi:transposase-like protein
MNDQSCPRCAGQDIIKSGIVKGRQRYQCKSCRYAFTVRKQGKNTDPYYVIKALQLYLEGISSREIERILGISHVSVLNWVKKYRLSKPRGTHYSPSYKVVSHEELLQFMKERRNLLHSGLLITELGDKYMVIKWDRFR